MDHDESAGWPGDGYDDDAGADDVGADIGDPDVDLPGVEPTDFDGIDPETAGTGDDLGVDSIDGGPAEDFASYLDGETEITDDVPLDADLPDPVPGTDPDRNWLTDDPAWAADPFPPALEFDHPPEPVDGWPWSDPTLLGVADMPALPEPDIGYPPGPPVSDLYAYDAAEPQPGDDSWASLAGSDDPATSSLARFWAPRD